MTNGHEPRIRDDKVMNRLLWTAVALISVVAFEALAVMTAMPTVVNDLDGRHLYALAVGSVMATQLITTAFAGPWVDAKGVRTPLLAGLLGLAVGLAICAVAPSIEIFVIGRAIQGLGGGLCIVPFYVLVGRLVPGTEQPRFFAAFAAAWVLPSLVGPALAGVIVQHAHWRLVFGIVPFVLVALIPLVLAVLRDLPELEWTGAIKNRRPLTIAALGTGIAVLVLQVKSGTEPGEINPADYVVIAVSIVAALACVRPLLPPHTLTLRRGLPATIAYRGLLNGAFIAVEPFLPLLLQEVHGWEPTPAGFVLTAGSVTWAIGSWAQARITKPEHRSRIALVGALVSAAAIAALIPTAWESVLPGFVMLFWAIGGFGLGLAYPAMTTHALLLTPPEHQGHTSSALQLADSLGAAAGLGIAGIMFAAAVTEPTADYVRVMVTLLIMAVGAVLIAPLTKPADEA